MRKIIQEAIKLLNEAGATYSIFFLDEEGVYWNGNGNPTNKLLDKISNELEAEDIFTRTQFIRDYNRKYQRKRREKKRLESNE